MPLSSFNGRRAWLSATAVLVGAAALTAPVPVSAQDSVTAALYPWVPRPQQFVSAVEAAWQAAHPTVELTVIMNGDVWDGGYHTEVQDDFDVFVFDAMYLQDYYQSGTLLPIPPGEVDDPDDFVDYARVGAMIDGSFAALPLLGCANILFYPQDDAALAAATTFDEVQAALGQCTYTSEVPPDRRGTMVDMSGTTSTATFYLDILHAQSGTYPPPLDPEVNPVALASQRDLLRVASYLNGTAETGVSYQRATWYNAGFGQSWIGFTESLSRLSAAARAEIAFKPMPLGDGTESPLFYADMVAVNAATADRGTEALAIRLANLIAATQTVVASIGVDGGAYDAPQFLLPARTSVFTALEGEDPLYGQLAALLDSEPLLFALGADVRDWLAATGGQIKTDVRANPQCGCDYVAPEPIPDNAGAAAICVPLCDQHGGWSGQWTNQPPAPAPSVCGCNACPAGLAATTVDPTPSINY